MNTNQTTLDNWTLNLDELKAKIADVLSWDRIEHEVMLLENGNVGIALLDVVNDWGEHLRDASEAEDDLVEALGARGTDCDEEIEVLNEMGLEDPVDNSWELTWRAVVLEL